MADRGPLSLFGLMIPTQSEAGTVTGEELAEAGLTFTDTEPRYIIMTFGGPLVGLNLAPGMEVEHKVLMTCKSAALLAAIITGHGEAVMGRVAFTAMLDQEISLVRQRMKEDGVYGHGPSNG